jgi:hypothetical protein
MLSTLRNGTSRIEMTEKDQTSLPTMEKTEKKGKRKRGTKRTHATRFMNAINTFNGSKDTEKLEHYTDRLQEFLQYLNVLDESVHDLLDDEE